MVKTNILLESGTNELEIVEFYIDENPKHEEDVNRYRGYYGINVAKVLEIIRMPELTDMPEVSHPAVLGAFNLRNQIIPLIDLAKWLGKERIVTEEPKVIVTEFNLTRSAFLVSGVTRIHRIGWEEVEAPTNYVSALTVNSITGVVKFTNRIVFILDMEKITADLNPGMSKAEEPAPQVVEEVRTRHLRALVVDDSNMARKMVAGVLEKAGFEVATAENGEQAWLKLLSIRDSVEQQNKPLRNYIDILVSDIEMPIMDGHNLTRRVKEDHTLKHLPVVLCSSIITDTLRHKGSAVGADDQVSKAELGELAGKVLQLVER
ncbi:chemotaxis protein [Salidesulfovibrio onnuriiensis]|uniref:chemotaxis protein n=1 Tax=Salidesulfovibrio onnuriiensis TaxID=2583823 RepID=UPI0011C8A86B|nr:chemotaxis protein [Salidesulfovibrio onnuriiensis]